MRLNGSTSVRRYTVLDTNNTKTERKYLKVYVNETMRINFDRELRCTYCTSRPSNNILCLLKLYRGTIGILIVCFIFGVALDFAYLFGNKINVLLHK